MVAVNRKISWDKTALHDFKEAINYIHKNSVQNADKVKKDILSKIKKMAFYPETGRPDKEKLNNDNSYRAFYLHHYRISYLVKENEIIIAFSPHKQNTNKILSYKDSIQIRYRVQALILLISAPSALSRSSMRSYPLSI